MNILDAIYMGAFLFVIMLLCGLTEGVFVIDGTSAPEVRAVDAKCFAGRAVIPCKRYVYE